MNDPFCAQPWQLLIISGPAPRQTYVFIADGEIVAFKDGVSIFSMLQQRMQFAHPSGALCRAVPVWFYLFDLLYIDVYDIRRVPLKYRKELLHRAFDFGGCLRFTKHREKEGEAYYRDACPRGLEGIVAKDELSEYVSKGTRSWLKFKCAHEQEFIVVGYTDPRGEVPWLRRAPARLSRSRQARICGQGWDKVH